MEHLSEVERLRIENRAYDMTMYNLMLPWHSKLRSLILSYYDEAKQWLKNIYAKF